MDNNSKHKARRSVSSMDGMLSSGPRKSYSTNSGVQTGARSKPKRLDDFNKKDGFYRQSTQPVISSKGSFELDTKTTDSFSKSLININSPKPRFSSPNISSRSKRKENKKQKRYSKWKIFKRSFLLTFVIAVGTFGYLFGKAWLDTNRALQGGGSALALSNEIDPNSLTGEGDGRVNVLLLGKGGDQHEGGQLTDSIMIASIDTINKGVVMLSVPRDLWVKPDKLWPMKINAVYNSAKEQYLYNNPKNDKEAEKVGIQATEKVIEDYLGVKINYYGMIDFTVFEESVNILGGVTVNLPVGYGDPTMKIGKKYLDLPAGVNELDGGTALGLARSRYGSYDGQASRNDFGRGENQQLVLLAIKDKALSLGTFSNPLKISQLVNSFGDRVQTNLSIDDLKRMYELSKDIKNENVTNFDMAMEGEAVVTTGNIGGQSVVYPKVGVDDYSEVKKFVRLKLKDGFIIKENPSIIILNASGKPGAATKRAEELKSYGYNVTQVADAATSDLQYTKLIDNNKGQKKYTKRYLELRFGTDAVTKVDNYDLTPYVADYIILIGQNG